MKQNLKLFNSEEVDSDVTLDVKFRNQKFILIQNGKEIKFKEGAQFQILINTSQVFLEGDEPYYEPITVMKEGEKLEFKIKDLKFVLILCEDLKMIERNGSSKLSKAVSYTHLRAHETREDLVCRLLLEKKK